MISVNCIWKPVLFDSLVHAKYATMCNFAKDDPKSGSELCILLAPFFFHSIVVCFCQEFKVIALAPALVLTPSESLLPLQA